MKQNGPKKIDFMKAQSSRTANPPQAHTITARHKPSTGDYKQNIKH